MCIAEHQRPLPEGWKIPMNEVLKARRENVKIVYTKYGTANRFENHIEIHEKLKNYPDLHDFIVEHELKHDQGEVYTGKDFRNDFMINIFTKKHFKLLKSFLGFVITTPSSWKQFFPVYKTEHGTYFDVGMTLVYMMIIGVGGAFLLLIYGGLI